MLFTVNDDKEGELAVFLKDCASVGSGRTKREVMTIAESVADRKGIMKKDKISSGWWHQFKER